jgi:hypothetical protein
MMSKTYCIWFKLVWLAILSSTTLNISLSLDQMSRMEMMKRSSLIFVGTVVKKGAVSFSGVQSSKNTAILKVDRILEKPKGLAVSNGQHVTIQLKDPTALQEGAQATFYTEGWVLGSGIAVKEIGHERAGNSSTALTPQQQESEMAQARKELQDAELRARIERADIVAIGRVTSVHAAAIAGPTRKFITEHDPDWQEAVVRVDSALKGASVGQQIVVRFPGSEDVLYYGVPKFKEGQEGVFLLQKDKETGLPKPMISGGQVESFIVRAPADYLTKNEAGRVRAMMKK